MKCGLQHGKVTITKVTSGSDNQEVFKANLRRQRTAGHFLEDTFHHRGGHTETLLSSKEKIIQKHKCPSPNSWNAPAQQFDTSWNRIFLCAMHC